MGVPTLNFVQNEIVYKAKNAFFSLSQLTKIMKHAVASLGFDFKFQDFKFSRKSVKNLFLNLSKF